MKKNNRNIKKGGRPPKAFGQKKSYRVNIKLITEEYYSLIAKVKKSGMTISGFVRDCLRKGYVKERLSEEQVSYIRQLSGMANNLNQIARKANTQGYTSVRAEYLLLAERIDNLLNSLGQ
ncbi:MAG: MobC family plasmid mobilization relaxosome protein [Prevotella sp.]|nr:MobC family plasmid mobilization relaxosome protein [Prevotella sp.]